VEKTVQSGEVVDISDHSEELLWISIHYRPSLFHRLVAFLYKSEIILISVTLDNGSEKVFRLPTGTLEQGFLLNPFLENNKSLENFLNAYRGDIKLSGFSIHCLPGQTWFNTKYFDLELSIVNSQSGL